MVVQTKMLFIPLLGRGDDLRFLFVVGAGGKIRGGGILVLLLQNEGKILLYSPLLLFPRGQCTATGTLWYLMACSAAMIPLPDAAWRGEGKEGKGGKGGGGGHTQETRRNAHCHRILRQRSIRIGLTSQSCRAIMAACLTNPHRIAIGLFGKSVEHAFCAALYASCLFFPPHLS